MLINVHDFSGHPFQVQLSRQLAARGHQVEHTYSAQYVTGRGKLELQPSDPETFSITPLTACCPLDKYDPKARIRFELNYALAWRQFLSQRSFDVVVACNLPLISQARSERWLQRHDVPWVFWHQDIYSHGMTDEVRRRARPAAGPLGRAVEGLEKRQIRNADRVVAISHTFVAKYVEWGLPTAHVTVIPNWACLDDVRPTFRDNAWARAHNLPVNSLRLLYSGTLGRKHNPLLLLELLDALKSQGVPAHLTVCSEGVGADDLERAAGQRDDVRLLGFQPAQEFEEVLSSCDVAVALLEPDASNFSVPSKVLSYLAAGRPVVGLIPLGNPAGADILAAGGYVTQPDSMGVEAAARWIMRADAEPGALAQIGKQSRAFAESRFDISAIADRFEILLKQIVERSSVRAS